MAVVIVTLRIMPESPDVDLSAVRDAGEKAISDFGGKLHSSEEEPIAFGLKALKLIFTMDESLGGTDPLEEKISEIEGVQSVEAVDVRRAIG